jgi:hypothetical protein
LVTLEEQDIRAAEFRKVIGDAEADDTAADDDNLGGEVG